MYTLVGYEPKGDSARRIRLENSARFRRELAAKIKALSPQHVEITHLPKKCHSILRIDDSFMVAVLLCKQKRRNNGELHWVVQPPAVERNYITLVGRLNRTHEDVVSFHLFSGLPHQYHRSFENDPWLNTGVQLTTLSEFCSSVTKLWAETKATQISNAVTDIAQRGVACVSAAGRSKDTLKESAHGS